MHPVDCLVEIERVPSYLVGHLVPSLLAVDSGIRIVCLSLSGFEWRVCGGWENSVQPRLLVFMSRCGEGGARELFAVQSIWALLWIILADWDGSLYGFAVMVTIKPILILVLFLDFEVCDWHCGRYKGVAFN